MMCDRRYHRILASLVLVSAAALGLGWRLRRRHAATSKPTAPDRSAFAPIVTPALIDFSPLNTPPSFETIVSIEPLPIRTAPVALITVLQMSMWFVAAAAVCAAAGWVLQSSRQSAFNPWAAPFFVGSAGLFIMLVIMCDRVSRAQAFTWPKWTWRAAGLSALMVVAFCAADVNFNTEDLSTEVGSTLLWVFAVIAAVVIAWQRGEKRSSAGKSIERREALALAAIMLLALGLRVIDLNQVPYVIMGDETKYGLVSRYLLEHQVIKPFTTGMDGHWYFYYSIAGAFIQALGSTAEAMRLPSALAGTLVVVTTYAVARQLWGRRVALIAAALMATYSHNIQFSRLGFNSIYDPLFSMLIFGWLWLAWHSGKRSAWLMAAVAAGLSQYFFFGGRLVLIQVTVLGLFWLVAERRKLRTQLLNMGLAIAVFLVMVMPVVYFATIRPDDYFGALNSKNIYRSGWLQAEMEAKGISEIDALGEQVQSVVTVLAIESDSPFYWRQAMLIPSIAVLAVLGLAYFIHHLREGPFFWVVSSLVLLLLFGGVLTVAPTSGDHRLLGVGPLIYLAVAVILDQLLRLFERRLPRPRLIAVLGVAAIAALMMGDVYYYFVGYIADNEFRGPEMSGNLVRHYLVDTYHGWHDQPLQIACVGYNADYCHSTSLQYFAPQMLDQSDVIIDLVSVAAIPPPGDKPQIVIINSFLAQEVPHAQQRYAPLKMQSHYDPAGDLIFVSFEVPPLPSADNAPR